MSYIVLRGRWCNIIVLNVHAPSEEKSDSSKDIFYEELEQAFDHFPKYDTKILLGDFNDMRELIVAFRNSANGPKTVLIPLSLLRAFNFNYKGFPKGPARSMPSALPLRIRRW